MTSKTSKLSKSRTRPRSYTSGTSIAEMQLQHLKPTTELLTYYQQKFEQLNKENFEMQERVEECMSLCDFSTQLEQELLQRNAEVSSLQQVISDLQVYLYQEREQSLRLYAENDKLRLREIEDRKKIDLLLTLSGTSESELGIFLYGTENGIGLCVPQKLPTRLQSYKGRLNVISKGECGSRKLDQTSSTFEGLGGKVVNLQAQMLASQLEEQTRLARDNVQALLKDRELTQKEHQVERDRLQSHISSLVSRLKLTQDKLCIATSDFLTLQEDYRSEEMKWVEQKDQMRQKLEICKNELGESYPNHLGYTISGSGSSSKRLLHNKSGDLGSLKEQLREQDSLVTLYRNQSFLLEEELKKVRIQSDNGKRLLKDRTQKLGGQVTYLKSKYSELDRRRILEAEGFRNDIKMLRNRMQNLEKNYYKISHTLTPTQVSLSSDKENQLLASTARDTLIKAQQLKQELRLIKNKVHEIESDLRGSS